MFLLAKQRFANAQTVVWLVAAAVALWPILLTAQDTKIWEFSPYEVQVWYQFEPAVPITESAARRFSDDFVSDLERTFKSAWRISLAPTPPHISSEISRSLPDLQINSLSQNEFTLVVSTTHQESKSVRTFQATADAVSKVRVSPATHAALSAALRRTSLAAEEPAAKLLARMEIDEAGDESIIKALQSESIAAAFLPRNKATGIDKTRPLISPLPWQTDTILSQRDKVFFVNCSMNGDEYEISVRELDCSMLHMGPMFTYRATDWNRVPRLASFAVQQAFAPVARVEAAEASTAQLRHKAGGLIVDDSTNSAANPARIRVGDVLQPIIRRDDKNGNPTLLQVLNFTYCVITDSDGVKMNANIYTYSGGPGLQGRQNRRTQRVVLRVRPAVEHSDLQVVVRGQPQKPQPGCFIYTKDLLTNQFDFLGRTDWRGRISIPAPKEAVSILPEEVRLKRVQLYREAREKAVAKAQADYDAAVIEAQEKGNPPPKPPETVPAVPEIPIDAATTVKLNTPLVQLYVKSGDTVLAKLPYVPQLQRLDIAELLDDTLRLQAEAFIRGFQSEILDQIGLRHLLTARVKLLIQAGDLNKADETVKQLRALKNFNEMNDELGLIERSILEQSDDSVPRSAKSQIDRMIKATRDMLQKHLQEDVAATAADLLRNATESSRPTGEIQASQ